MKREKNSQPRKLPILFAYVASAARKGTNGYVVLLNMSILNLILQR